MTTITSHPAPAAPSERRRTSKGRVLASWLSTTDHKVIGYMYLIT